jgi:excisionase family DNA binding protein
LEFLNVNQLSEMLGITRHQVYTLTRKRSNDRIPHLVIGKCLRFRRESVLAWAAAKEQEVRG